MENIKKSVNKILEILDDVQENLDAAYVSMTAFCTSLKGKDINQAYFNIIELKRKVNLALNNLDSTVDDYETKVIKLLEEEDNARKK